MALVVVNTWKVKFEQLMVATLNTLTLRLFKNNYVPTDTDTVANYTQADFTGYASQALTTWGASYLNGSNQSESDAGVYVFTQTGVAVTCDIYGYYITDNTGALVYAERSATAPFTMNVAGLVYLVAPIMLLDNM